MTVVWRKICWNEIRSTIGVAKSYLQGNYISGIDAKELMEALKDDLDDGRVAGMVDSKLFTLQTLDFYNNKISDKSVTKEVAEALE